jgi:hypothetical protein
LNYFEFLPAIDDAFGPLSLVSCSGNSIGSGRIKGRPLKCQRDVSVASTCIETSPFRLAKPSLPSFLSVSQSGRGLYLSVQHNPANAQTEEVKKAYTFNATFGFLITPDSKEKGKMSRTETTAFVG